MTLLPLLLGFLSWVVIGVVTYLIKEGRLDDAWQRLRSRRRKADALEPPKDPLEVFCEGEPIILALRCRKGHAERIVRTIRRMLGHNSEIVNPHGQSRWLAHRIRVEVRCASDQLVTVHAIEAIPARREVARTEPMDIVRGVGAECSHIVEQVWLYGQLFAETRYAFLDRERIHWVMWYDDRGRPYHETMIGRPSWLRSPDTPRSPPS